MISMILAKMTTMTMMMVRRSSGGVQHDDINNGLLYLVGD
jgi:hypothetical protein